MTRARALLLLLLVFAPTGRAFADAGDPALGQDIQAFKAEVDAENARLQSLDATETQLLGVSSTAYGPGSNPVVEAALSTEVQDIDGFGRAGMHGTAITELLDLRITDEIDSTRVQFEFHPSVSPGVVNNEGFGVATDNQDTMDAVPWAGPTPPGVLFDRARLSFLWKADQLTFGFAEFNDSVYVLNGPLYARPDYFDPDPSDGRNTPVATSWQQTFDSEGYQVTADNSEHEFMGITDKLRLPEELTLNLFSGINEYYYLNGNAIHEDGAQLQVGTFKRYGSQVNLLFVNQANNPGELASVGVVNPQDPLNGLQNSSASSLQYSQKLGPVGFQGEAAYAFENNPMETVQGLAWHTDFTVPAGPLRLGAGGGYTAPSYVVEAGEQNVTGMNMVSGTADPLNPGHMLYDTEISDPTAPMNNTVDYGANASLALRFLHLSATLLDHSQIEASSPVIESSHFLNGSNVTGGGWWALYNNNYAPWVAAPQPTENANENLNNYNSQYLPQSGGETDADGRVYDDAYHEMETDLWRTNSERLLTSNAAGQPLLPSRKNIAYASCDARVDLGGALAMNREVYLDLFQDFESVDDAALPAPDTDPENLFNQDVGEATLVYAFLPRVYGLLNVGYETWIGDRFADSFVNSQGQTVSARLEYYETSAGVGLDWDISPQRLKAMVRLKAFTHEDAADGENDFSARQMLWELQSWF